MAVSAYPLQISMTKINTAKENEDGEYSQLNKTYRSN